VRVAGDNARPRLLADGAAACCRRGVFFCVGFLFSFIWSIKSNQYDGFYTPSVRILFENETETKPIENNKEEL